MTPTPDQPRPDAALKEMSNEELVTAYWRNGITFALTDDRVQLGHVTAHGADMREEVLRRMAGARETEARGE